MNDPAPGLHAAFERELRVLAIAAAQPVAASRCVRVSSTTRDYQVGDARAVPTLTPRESVARCFRGNVMAVESIVTTASIRLHQPGDHGVVVDRCSIPLG